GAGLVSVPTIPAVIRISMVNVPAVLAMTIPMESVPNLMISGKWRRYVPNKRKNLLSQCRRFSRKIRRPSPNGRQYAANN
ncbi:MAG: hypothetical protein K2L00_01730, partial [Muribaculaceae bacterium]|nr:hypothetical protein [Muribaculaceae bacterium]